LKAGDILTELELNVILANHNWVKHNTFPDKFLIHFNEDVFSGVVITGLKEEV
jgi:hypothetical protein